MNDQGEELRPRSFALLLLASGDVAVRNRARDQQADVAGLAMKRQILEELVAVDPEANDMAEFLFTIHERFASAVGVRSLALALMQDWEIARATPNWAECQLGLAVQGSLKENTRRGRQLPG